jgi:hypothetical protein
MRTQLTHSIYQQTRMAKGFGFYGVRKGQRPGIYLSWAECESQVKGFPVCHMLF